MSGDDICFLWAYETARIVHVSFYVFVLTSRMARRNLKKASYSNEVIQFNFVHVYFLLYNEVRKEQR